MKNIIGICILAAALLTGLGCANRHSNDTSYKDAVSKALEQADLKDVTVTEDRDRNTITLGGKVHSDDARAKAGDVAKSAAPSRIIANEISVQPVDAASEAKDIASDLDAGIEKNYKAALISTVVAWTRQFVHIGRVYPYSPGSRARGACHQSPQRTR
jgi:hypothetical protein